MSIRAIIAHDQEMIRAGLHAILENDCDVHVVVEVEDGRSALRMAASLQPDVILMAVKLPLLNGIEATRQVRSANPMIRVLLLAQQSELHVVSEAVRAGASAYLLLSSASDELMLAIRAACRDETWLSPKVTNAVVSDYIRTLDRPLGAPTDALTPAQRAILQLLADGKSNKEVAAYLSLSTEKVETHRAQITRKLQIRSMAGLTKFAIRHGLTSVDC